MGSDVATKSERATLREAVDHRGSGDGAATSLVGMGLTDVTLLHKMQNKITTAKMLLRVVIMKDVASSRGDECQLYYLQANSATATGLEWAAVDTSSIEIMSIMGAY